MDDVGFDLTSMIDVVLLLIIFFVLSAQFGVAMLSAMDLPRQAGAPAPASGTQQVVIDLTSEGTLRIEGNAVEYDRLLQLLASDLRKAGTLDVLVRADRAGSAAHLNRLASGLAGLGIRDWKLATAGGKGAS